MHLRDCMRLLFLISPFCLWYLSSLTLSCVSHPSFPLCLMVCLPLCLVLSLTDTISKSPPQSACHTDRALLALVFYCLSFGLTSLAVFHMYICKAWWLLLSAESWPVLNNTRVFVKVGVQSPHSIIETVKYFAVRWSISSTGDWLETHP